jgi:hypothetical protein
MPLAFAGPATPLDDRAIERAARSIGCQVAAVRAVIDVESRGGFLDDKRPKILFERHYFSKLTDGQFDARHPEISNPKPGGYLGGTQEYARLDKAIKLSRSAALRSASWGSFQIMGDNFAACGFADVESFVAAMVSGAPAHLDAFVKFVKKKGLGDEMIRRDWAGFARGYNGPAYKINKYDEKLAAQYAFHLHGGSRTDGAMPVLREGDRGEPVEVLQNALGLAADGHFGPGTRAALVAFQKKRGLFADGVAGKGTWAALGVVRI